MTQLDFSTFVERVPSLWGIQIKWSKGQNTLDYNAAFITQMHLLCTNFTKYLHIIWSRNIISSKVDKVAKNSA